VTACTFHGTLVTRTSLVEDARHHFDDAAGGHIDEQQIRPVAHPLRAGRGWIETECRPIGIVVLRREEDRRQYRADGPRPIRPARRINEGRKTDRIEEVPVVAELLMSAWSHRAQTRSRPHRTGAPRSGSRRARSYRRAKVRTGRRSMRNDPRLRSRRPAWRRTRWPTWGRTRPCRRMAILRRRLLSHCQSRQHQRQYSRNRHHT
jgi:hypothetical protein